MSPFTSTVQGACKFLPWMTAELSPCYPTGSSVFPQNCFPHGMILHPKIESQPNEGGEDGHRDPSWNPGDTQVKNKSDTFPSNGTLTVTRRGRRGGFVHGLFVGRKRKGEVKDCLSQRIWSKFLRTQCRGTALRKQEGTGSLFGDMFSLRCLLNIQT